MNLTVLLSVGVIGTMALSVIAQPEWRQTAPPFTSVAHHAMVYDEAREQVVLFGGIISDPTDSYATADVLRSNRLWGWDGQEWEYLSETGPSFRSSAAIAYDSAREQVLVYGGTPNGYNFLNDLWAWDGSEWALLVENGPALAGPVAMTYDPVRAETVLVGIGEAETCETWAWDGVAWSQRLVAGPLNRKRHAMVFDPISEKIVLVGGTTQADSGSWTWDGVAWAEVGLAEPFTPTEHSVTYDPTRGGVIAMIKGGLTGDLELRQLVGTSWETVPTTAWVGFRDGFAMVFDPVAGSVMLTGGTAWAEKPSGTIGNVIDGKTFVLRGGAWEAVTTDAWRDTFSPVMAYDKGRETVVMFGGKSRLGPEYHDPVTALREGGQWRVDHSETPDHHRTSHGMVYDEARGETLLFGGQNMLGYSTQLINTWAWTGDAWELRASDGPSPRSHFGFANDTARGEVVLFGGAKFVGESTNGGPLSSMNNETWIWNGTVWEERLVEGPLKRFGPAMAYDPVRQETVLFGGRAYDPDLEPRENRTYFSQATWCWDGTEWTQRGVGGPPPRAYHHMVYDDARGCVLLYGGQDENYDTYTDLWRWDGEVWTEIPLAGAVPPEWSAAVYDTSLEEIVLACNTVASQTGYTQPQVQIWSLPSRCSKADLNADGYLDIGDISAFVELFITGDVSADLNGDGILDISDIIGFVDAFLTGC